MPLYFLLSILLAGNTTLPSGIRVYDLQRPAKTGDFFEAIVGYRTGVNSETNGTDSLAAVVAMFLKSSPSARAMAVAAYGAGGEVEYFSDLERTGIRLKMPNWARPMVEDSIAEFLSESPRKNPELVDRALNEVRFRAASSMAATSSMDVLAKIEEQFRTAMLGSGALIDLQAARRETIEKFFAENYGTNRAFVLMNAVPSPSLQAVESRSSPTPNQDAEIPRKPSPPFYIPSDLDEGMVIMGVAVPSIYYRNWYALLMLDRLIQQTVPSKPRTVIRPSLDTYFYRMEVPVPLGQTAEMMEATLRQELQQLEYVPASSQSLETARRSAIQYLESESVQLWFQSLGVPERRLEGIDWLRAFSADDMRAAARDVVETHPVIAGFSPRVRSLRLDTENLADISARKSNASSLPVAPRHDALAAVRLAPFPPHDDTTTVELPPVRLDSGVSVVASSAYAVFVAPNILQVFEREPDTALLQTSFGAFRANRILVMAPPSALDRVKQQWAGFRGNLRDQEPVPILGNITSVDIPALLVLKMLLDRRLIEAGLWNDVHLEIRASQGSTLTVQGSDTDRRIVLDWLREFAALLPAKADIEWAREAAIHHLSEFRPDLQSLIWEWNPDGVLTDIRFIPDTQLQEVARIYLQ
jgi:hypothetical protein